MITKPKPLKPKTCKACKAKFTPVKQMQSVCDWNCAAAHAEQLRIKREASEAYKSYAKLIHGEFYCEK